MNRPKHIQITNAVYLNGYKIELQFNDHATRIVDFESFLLESRQPMTTKYRDKKKFKKFSVRYGNLDWNDGDMNFPIAALYSGDLKLKEPSGRVVMTIKRTSVSEKSRKTLSKELVE